MLPSVQLLYSDIISYAFIYTIMGASSFVTWGNLVMALASPVNWLIILLFIQSRASTYSSLRKNSEIKKKAFQKKCKKNYYSLFFWKIVKSKIKRWDMRMIFIVPCRKSMQRLTWHFETPNEVAAVYVRGFKRMFPFVGSKVIAYCC